MTSTQFIFQQKIVDLVLLFNGVSSDILKPILADCQQIKYPAETILLSPETNNSYVYVILEGCVSVYLENDLNYEEHNHTAIIDNDKNRLLLSTINVGEVVGDMSVIDDNVPSAWVSTVEDCLLLCLEKRQIWTLINQSHHFARNLLVMLSHRIRYSTQVVADGVRLQHQHEMVARIDVLTGLYNRRCLDDLFRREMTRHDIEGSELCLLMVDVDFFKNYNDNNGHLAGDRVLYLLGRLLRKTLRRSDLIVRYGGEEFLILLPHTDINHALRLSNNLLQIIADLVISYENGVSLPSITVSIGLSQMCSGDDLAILIGRADAAMYQAKHNGRNCVITK
ncbi:MAG: GGDEF domain-containing protein [Mariprofundales bacterium]